VRRIALPVPPLPPGRPRLVLAGFIGTGKTTAGRLAAERLRLGFVDLDGVLVRRAGARTTGQVWLSAGEPEFRRRERVAMRDAARLSGTAVATGGGAVLVPDAFGELAAGSSVSVLTADPAELLRRLRADPVERPTLLPDIAARVDELLAERREAYATAGPPLDTTGRTLDDVADELARRYREAAGGDPFSRIEVRGADRPYPVVVGGGAIDRLGPEVVAAQSDVRSAAVVFDPAVAAVAEGPVSASLQAEGLRIACVAVPSGEGAKTADVVAALWSAFLRAGLDPTDVVVAVGGGATLDAAGFAAATYARGIALVNVPTTALAMADAGLGGKVAIDHGGVKNLVGAFHDPVAVVVDPATLRTLPEHELRAGLAEVVKAGLLASPLLLDALEELIPADEPGLAWVFEQAVRIKAAYVAADPRDRQVRHALNLGHSYAHAIESATGYAVPHGEAVAMGLAAAARLGSSLGITPAGVTDRVTEVLVGLGLPAAAPEGIDPDRLASAMLADKKRRGGRAVFVVPAVEGVELVDGLDPRVAVEALVSDRERAAPR
jgi:shikimate kinase / 3-dehydroquinate synthase